MRRSYEGVLESSLYYPSLSSPVSSLFSRGAESRNIRNVFERLQEDTENRLRARNDCYSVPKGLRLRSKSPAELSLISSIRLKNNVSLSARRRTESHSELTFKPEINKVSQMIFKNKLMKNAQFKRRVAYDDDEYSNPVEIEDGRSQTSRNHSRCSKVPQKSEAKEPASQTKDPAKLIEKPAQLQLITKESTTEPSEVCYTNRKYTPLFTKPFDVSKILGKRPQNPPKPAKPLPKSLTKPTLRPLLRPISDSQVRTEDALIYKKIVQDRQQPHSGKRPSQKPQI